MRDLEFIGKLLYSAFLWNGRNFQGPKNSLSFHLRITADLANVIKFLTKSMALKFEESAWKYFIMNTSNSFTPIPGCQTLDVTQLRFFSFSQCVLLSRRNIGVNPIPFPSDFV